MAAITKHSWKVFFFIFLAILPILILRDYTPDNELKYLSIADEAIENGNIFAFYNHNVPYADKPPMYLWIVIAGKLIFGEHIMLFLSLFSMIPALVTIAVMNKWVSKYLSDREKNTAILLLFTSAFYLACSIVLRMDMLMTMFITLALYTFYKMYRFNKDNGKYAPDKKRYTRWQILLPVYIFLAIFSKGAVGILLPVVSIIVFLAIGKNIKTIGKYLGWRTWTILGILCGIWFAGVYIDGGTEYLNNLLFNQTINRAVDSFHHKEPIWYYCVTYWYAIAPWSLLTFIVILLGYIKGVVKTDIEKLFATVTFCMVIMMSLISSKIVIYLLPCFPFMLYLTALLLPKLKNNFWVKLSVATPAVIFILPFIFAVILQFTPTVSNPENLLHSIRGSLDLIPLRTPLYLITAILAIGGVAALLFINRNINTSIKCISAALLLFIFTASISLPSLNNMIGLDGGCKKAIELANEIEKENTPTHTQTTQNDGLVKAPQFAFYDFRAGLNLDAYFKKYMQQSGKYTKAEISAFSMRQLQKEELSTVSNIVMFVKTRDFNRDSVLNSAMGTLPRYNFGEFSIVPVR